MKTDTIKLAAGERIDVIKEAVGYSINGPAIIVVLKEEAAAGATAESNDNVQNHRC